MVHLQVFVSDPDNLTPLGAAAVKHVQAAAGRFQPGQVGVSVLPLTHPAAVERGLSLEPAVLVGDLLIAVGQAPPAGHVVRALEAALQREEPRHA
jgi:hypothetical protein